MKEKILNFFGLTILKKLRYAEACVRHREENLELLIQMIKQGHQFFVISQPGEFANREYKNTCVIIHADNVKLKNIKLEDCGFIFTHKSFSAQIDSCDVRMTEEGLISIQNNLSAMARMGGSTIYFEKGRYDFSSTGFQFWAPEPPKE